MKGQWEFETSESLGTALEGADFVVISILPGTFDEMESDVHLPERYGIYQSVGDTTTGRTGTCVTYYPNVCRNCRGDTYILS